MTRDNRTTSEIHGTRLTAPAVYAAVRRDGEEELRRPPGSLWWSGVVAGLAIATSLLAKGLLHEKLPANEWRSVLENFGYCVGFIIVVLGRMQLFTENTITVVLPLIADKSRRTLYLTARLWLIVFTANMVGAAIAALAMHYGFASPAQLEAMHSVAQPLMDKSWGEMLLHSIPAGFLVAALVWMLPNGRGFEIWVIVLTTYLIGLGGFAHIVVGAGEAGLLLLAGKIGLVKALWGFVVPALIGNILGGTLLFSFFAYGQVRKEIHY